MTELSSRFAELMARLSKSDADLFREVASQNNELRSIANDLVPELEKTVPQLPQASLLPPEECELKSLKLRFKKIADARIWIEQQLGPAPKHPTWAVVQQTIKSGSWPIVSNNKSTKSALSSFDLDHKLAALEQRLNNRLDTLQALIIELHNKST
jgi:hypothetical protein